MVQAMTFLQHYPQPTADENRRRHPLLVREQFSRLDRSAILTADRAILMGVARDYNPAGLDYDRGDVQHRGQTVVRIVFDVEPAPPTPTTDADDDQQE
jgi:hypothetical protein